MIDKTAAMINNFTRRAAYCYTITTIVLALTACAHLTAIDDESAEIKAAQHHEQQGRFAEAAKTYQAYAQTLESEAALRTRAMAADAWISANELKRARTLACKTPKQTEAETVAWCNLVTTRLHLRDRQPKLALQSLPPHNTALPRHLQIRILRVGTETYATLQQPLNEARNWFALRQIVGDDRLITRKLWIALAAMPLEQLRELMPPPPDDFGGWLELAYLYQQHRWRFDDFQRETTQWQQRYPKHPAQGLLVQLQQEAEQLSRVPTKVAVLLPLSGKLAAAGNAIRDGMLAAHLHTDRLGTPEFRFYDASQPGGIDTLLKKIQQDGAQFAVGPLDKAVVDQLAKRASLPLPTLALNYTQPNAQPPINLYQFGLLPEDEGMAMANYLHQHGARNPVVLIAESPWGQRISRSFKAHWQKLTQRAAREIKYRNETRDFTATLQNLLSTQPDAIALGAFPAAGRLINSQLRALSPNPPLIVAASQVYTGRPDPKQDQDLEGVIVGDGEWLLSPEAAFADVYQHLQKQQPQQLTQYGRLIAMGIDAYELVIQLPALRSGQLPTLQGATGLLRIDSHNQIHRTLAWAQFQNGAPVLIASPSE
jgi:uncharacterized protein